GLGTGLLLQLPALAGDGVRPCAGGDGLLTGALLVGAGGDLRADGRWGRQLGRRRCGLGLATGARPEGKGGRGGEDDDEATPEELELMEVEPEEQLGGWGGDLGEQLERRHESPLLRQLTLSSTPGGCGKSRPTACAARLPSSPCSVSSLPASSRRPAPTSPGPCLPGPGPR